MKQLQKKRQKRASGRTTLPSANRKLFDVHRLDARRLRELVPKNSVDVTITSPPYFDLKDYGSKKQIGFGQEYEEYIRDIGDIFSGVFDCTKPSGSLWVVIDSFRRDGEVVPLPFDFSAEIRKHGWKLQDVIIWGKDRTVPWSQKGQMRSLFEYILVFSKSTDFVFNIDRVRSHRALKKWWVKYPERYNPNGKSPDAIWHFDIPVQGSWGDGFIRHFCPLPEEMIGQILEITTDENDVVLDPFSGSGAVLSRAHAMKRNYIGLELNSEYIKMFKRYLRQTGKTKRTEYDAQKKTKLGHDNFYKAIINLRALKVARVLLKNARSKKLARISKIFVAKSKTKPAKKNALVCVDYYFLLEKKGAITRLSNFVNKSCLAAPLSKYGIEFRFFFETNEEKLLQHIPIKRVYTYTSQATHKSVEYIDKKRAVNVGNRNPIISGIRVNIEEKVDG